MAAPSPTFPAQRCNAVREDFASSLLCVCEESRVLTDRQENHIQAIETKFHTAVKGHRREGRILNAGITELQVYSLEEKITVRR